jgi:hypothetical protein
MHTIQIRYNFANYVMLSTYNVNQPAGDCHPRIMGRLVRPRNNCWLLDEISTREMHKIEQMQC